MVIVIRFYGMEVKKMVAGLELRLDLYGIIVSLPFSVLKMAALTDFGDLRF